MEAAPEAVERAADELYRLPLPDFTKARDELARRLRKEGRREEADAVKALRKPTVAAWTLNQLARQRPKDVARLLAIGKRLREAQEALLGGGGERSALQRASAEERELVAKLTRDATAVAGEAGTTATGSVDERIRSTLHAAALDEQTAAELAAGRLVREREAVGLFGTASVEATPARKRAPADEPRGRPAAQERATTAPRSPAKRRDADASRKAAERRRTLERGLAEARAEARKAQRERTRTAKATERAGKQAQDAQGRADDARTRAEAARAALREAQQQERQAAKAHDRAARAVASAEKKLAD